MGFTYPTIAQSGIGLISIIMGFASVDSAYSLQDFGSIPSLGICNLSKGWGHYRRPMAVSLITIHLYLVRLVFLETFLHRMWMGYNFVVLALSTSHGSKVFRSCVALLIALFETWNGYFSFLSLYLVSGICRWLARCRFTTAGDLTLFYTEKLGWGVERDCRRSPNSGWPF